MLGHFEDENPIKGVKKPYPKHLINPKDKNNAIETSHKEDEKKHEWDGKFSSSTIRDDAKDEKAMDEESDEIMEDAGLEEIEKLKSWEIFLKGQGGVESDVSPSPSEHIDMTGKNPTKRQRGHGVGTPQTVNGKTVPREVAQKPSGNVKTSRAGTFQDTKGTKNLTADDIEASAKRIGMITNNDLGAGTDKHVKTQDELDKEFYERTQPEPRGTKSHKRVISRRTRKSWEAWLEKDALNPDSKHKPKLMNTQRFARISTEVRGGNAQGGRLGDASLRGMRAEEKKRGKKYKWKNPNRKGRVGVESSTETPPNKKLYHGTERQTGNYPALGTDSGKKSGEKFAQLFQEEKKSWEVWLEKDALTNRWIETIPKKPVTNSMEDSQSFSRQSTGARYEQDPRGKRSASSIKWGKLGDVGELNYKKILNDKGEETEKYVKNSNVGGGKKNALAHGNKKRQQNAATKKPTIPPTGEAPTGVKKSWELWLEKDALDGKQGIDRLPKSSIKPILTEAQEVIDRDNRGKKNEMYKSWLEKMQGAGDARFGNQHLTGLDQKPVDNEEDEANILPEKDEKTDDKEEKQEKTEDKEDKDNKPYKA